MNEVSIVVPAHNAGDDFKHDMQRLHEFVQHSFNDAELIIAEDGSTDDTALHADELADRYNSVRAVHATQSLGKGGGLMNGFDEAKGTVLAFIDADLAPSLNGLVNVVNAVSSEQYDAAVGSRALSEAQEERPYHRRFASKQYNKLIRRMFNSSIQDHQCGCKAIRRDPYDALRPNLRSRDFFWDTEFLVRLQEQGHKVVEVPVEWSPQEESTVDAKSATPRMMTQLFALWVENRFS